MNYSEFTNEQNRRFQKCQNENPSTNLHRNDIYVDVVQSFYKKYQLPALLLDESGFSIGEADSEDMREVVLVINDLSHVDGCDPDLLNQTIEELEDDEFSEILSYLDSKLIEAEKEAYDNALKQN